MYQCSDMVGPWEICLKDTTAFDSPLEAADGKFFAFESTGLFRSELLCAQFLRCVACWQVVNSAPSLDKQYIFHLNDLYLAPPNISPWSFELPIVQPFIFG